MAMTMARIMAHGPRAHGPMSPRAHWPVGSCLRCADGKQPRKNTEISIGTKTGWHGAIVPGHGPWPWQLAMTNGLGQGLGQGLGSCLFLGLGLSLCLGPGLGSWDKGLGFHRCFCIRL